MLVVGCLQDSSWLHSELMRVEEKSSCVLCCNMLLSLVCNCNAPCAGGWLPAGHQLDALPELMRVEEESSLWGRIALTCLGWLHLRPLQLHFTGNQLSFLLLF
jgi:hypothetical protein